MDNLVSIRKSLDVFVCGLLGFLPIIGLLPAAYAFFVGAWWHYKLRDEWNPAGAYLKWGMLLGLFSLSIGTLTVLIMALQLVPPFDYD